MKGTLRDLIFISLENWDDTWRRNQFLCRELTTRFPDMKILFVGVPIDVAYLARTRRLKELDYRPPRPVPEYPNIHFFRPLKLGPESIALTRRLNESVFAKLVSEAARRIGIVDPWIWVNDHSARRFAIRARAAATIYDVTDDWALQPGLSPAKAARIARQDEHMCRDADLVIVCSDDLERSRSARGPKRLLKLPNGVDAAHYREVAASAIKAPNSRPVLAYVGSVHDSRVDLDLVVATARALPDAKIELIGPHWLSPAQVDRLATCPNVALVGPIRYSELPRRLIGVDVFLVPHHVSAFTESLNPIKLWEYFACGKPVVSTPVAGFREYPDLVRLSNSTEAFVEACREALAGDDASMRAARVAIARQNSWAKRGDELVGTLSGLGLLTG